MADILLSVGLQKGTTGTSQIEQDLSSIVKRINDNPPKVNIGLNVSDAALRTFKSQLQQIVNSVALTNGAPITVNISGLGEITAQASNAKTALTNMGEAAKKAGQSAATSANAAAAATANVEREAKEAARAEHERQALLRQGHRLLGQMQNAERNWTKAAKGNTREQYEDIKSYTSLLQTLLNQYESGAIDAARFRSELDSLSTRFADAKTQIQAAGEATKTLKDQFVGLASKFTSWLGTSQIVMLAFRSLKQMVSTVVELDSAMTELKKVTNETDATYTRFLNNAGSRAKALGATISDVVNSSADFARLGYDLDDAATLADTAIIYKNVGDGIEDINQASESIISTMQAFGIEASNAMSIVDKFNEVGNNFAISSTGIGEALLNSSSTLAAANNSLDESIALITAANEVIQSPEKVGTALKAMSMYIRAAKTEAEEAGVSTDGMANSVSELRQEILALTGNRVDIMVDDTTFKSTYQIIKELSAVWDSLDETTQANITELVGGGVRNANIVSALIKNFSTAEDVLASSINSAGSAIAENEKYLDSITGKISKFQAALQDLSSTIVNSDLVKRIVDAGTIIITTIDKILESTGALEKFMLGAFGATLGGFIKNLD